MPLVGSKRTIRPPAHDDMDVRRFDRPAPGRRRERAMDGISERSGPQPMRRADLGRALVEAGEVGSDITCFSPVTNVVTGSLTYSDRFAG